jgi:hypothetical protein
MDFLGRKNPEQMYTDSRITLDSLRISKNQNSLIDEIRKNVEALK